MSNKIQELQNALISGFIDHTRASKHTLKPELLVNDGQGRKRIMSSIVLTPKDSAFFEWCYDTDECIEQLSLLTQSEDSDINAGNTDLIYTSKDVAIFSEWIALLLETQSIAYYQNEFEEVSKLINAISSATLSLAASSTARTYLRDYPQLLNTGLRAILTQTQHRVDYNRLLELYRLLPKIPCAKTLDIYIMFQCHFGFSNILSRWQSDFNYYKQENGWHDYNAVQLEVGIALTKARIVKEPPLLTKLDEPFSDYILALENMPLAAEWFPWLSWFISQKCDKW